MHGAMVMQLHWSMVQWTFLSKILKKHDKRTGILLRQPLLARMAQEPFFSSKILERLIRELEELYSGQQGTATEGRATAATSEGSAEGGPSPPSSSGQYLLGTRAAEVQVALNTWREVAGNASTPSTLAMLPPAHQINREGENPSRASSTPPPPFPPPGHGHS